MKNSNLDLNLFLFLKQTLVERAIDSQCVPYKDLAAILGVTKAPIILRVTEFLEALIEEDVKENRPILSALAVQKGTRGLPRMGFFEKLHTLNVINITDGIFNEKIWHENELQKLKKFYKKAN